MDDLLKAENRMARVGQLVRQPGGYRALVPGAFPPEPPVPVAGELLRLPSAADRALGVLAGSVHTLPNPDLFVSMFVRKEAVFSSRTEEELATAELLMPSDEAKVPLSIRLDPEIVEFFREEGSGYQSRINAVLLGYVRTRKRRRRKRENETA